MFVWRKKKVIKLQETPRTTSLKTSLKSSKSWESPLLWADCLFLCLCPLFGIRKMLFSMPWTIYPAENWKITWVEKEHHLNQSLIFGLFIYRAADFAESPSKHLWVPMPRWHLWGPTVPQQVWSHDNQRPWKMVVIRFRKPHGVDAAKVHQNFPSIFRSGFGKSNKSPFRTGFYFFHFGSIIDIKALLILFENLQVFCT